MKVIITGAAGQLGSELVASAPPGFKVLPLSRAQLDISDSVAVADCIGRLRPELVINAAAYTAVDRAEGEPYAADSVNGDGPRFLANALYRGGGRLIQISTDYVFDGAQDLPYRRDDKPNPINFYGKSKLHGETHVQEILGERALIIRTAWLYSTGGANFVSSVYRAILERDEVSVVCDQIGSPTWVRTLARVVWVAADRCELRGVYHWADAGIASRYDFAVAIREEASRLGLLTGSKTILAIRSDAQPRLARRPRFSALDTKDTSRDFGIFADHWRVSLGRMFGGLCDPPSSAAKVSSRFGTRGLR